MTRSLEVNTMRDIELACSSRRDFLKIGAGLALAIQIGPSLAIAAEGSKPAMVPAFQPNAFLRIGNDGIVHVISPYLEMGQGTFTGVATLVAEELDADWSKVRVEGAPADVKRYGNPAFGGALQGTGGSTAMAGSWDGMRQAGATARAMLVAAAAEQWSVPASDISVSKSVVSAGNRSASFGELAEAASKQAVPANVPLKKPEQYTLIGKQKLPRKDGPSKCDGSAMYTQDIQLPGMLTAVIAHPPRFGGVLKSVDGSAAKKIPGVVAVLEVAPMPGVFRGGVAVLAKDTWTAILGRQALVLDWDDSGADHSNSTTMREEYRKLGSTPGKVAVDKGDHDKAFDSPAKLVSAVYEVPFLAHAAMEPMNCVIHAHDGEVEMWNGEQFHTPDQGALAKLFGVEMDKVSIHQLYAGGSFGRRANPKADYVLECATLVQAAMAAGHKVPIKLVWTREDDTQGGYYRPQALHDAQAALDADGNIIGWRQRVVGQSIARGTAMESMMIKDGVDATLIEGIEDLPYDIASLRIEAHEPRSQIPVQWWRSVGHTHTGFATEAFFDEVAHAASKDPYQFRRDLLSKSPRHLGVLNAVAEAAGWNKPIAKGKDGVRRGRGIAVHKSFNTYVAQIAEVSVQADGSFKVDRVVCVVDCGVAINPDVIRAQMEGGIGYGLSVVLHGAITLKDGVVEQSNFHDYKPLRMNQMPSVEVHILASSEKPTGVGEPGTAVVAPAVVNALFAATGKRVRQLPVDTTALRA